ncbi:MAG TPA: FAD-dependent oxidoreductase, partial [Longimicrobium sp.]|nr:FAD-dependent oxidoreductase [Longimicrobium sp.]
MRETSGTADVVIVGGGVIGCAIARRAARDGLSVIVLERGTPGMEASWAAAGMLSPLAEANEPGPFLDLLLRAREM